MSALAIRVNNLGKKYRIGGRQEGYGTLRDALASAVQVPLQMLRNRDRRIRPVEIWALRDVSFEVKPGEVLGIIGRNGAGKSTLLKILSRITYPTVGRAEIFGRVGSLLEVGTGFHPELTGRENIYLNGAVLGMKKAEIQRKFDEIVEFSEIAQFLDTPVKRYSSGMYMRLAFAIAAHLEPEILIVDEVLAVGDAAFQRKCLGKMENVAREGRTVLFVSHNMPAILSLCGRVMLLELGRLVDQGSPSSVVQNYLDDVMSSSVTPLDQRVDRSGDGSAKLISLQIESTDPDKVIRSGSRLKMTVGYTSDKPVTRPQFLITILDHMDIGIYLLHNDFVGGLPETLPPCGLVTCLTDPINLTPGRCYVHLELLKGNVQADYIPYAGHFEVEADDIFGTGMFPPREYALCILGHKWWLNQA
jgi:lipopolysaccharide transport system ATP-binding protein